MESVTNEMLMDEAKKARLLAYAPYSKFLVGAALLTDDGEIFHGCNIENAGYSLTNCAERTAIFSAISKGKKKFSKMAVVCDTERPGSPCGACRQVISEFFTPNAEIILTNLKGDVQVTTIAELLPGAFTPEDLNG